MIHFFEILNAGTLVVLQVLWYILLVVLCITVLGLLINVISSFFEKK